MTYEVIPYTIDALQFTGNNFNQLLNFVPNANIRMEVKGGIASCVIDTATVRLNVLESDYIIKSDIDEISVEKADVFDRKYKLVKGVN